MSATIDDWYGSPEAAASIPDDANTDFEPPRGVRESLPGNAVGVWIDAYKAAVDLGDDSEETRAQAGWDAVRAQGWRKDENGRWHKTDKRLLRAGADAALAMLRLSIATAVAKDYTKQPRVPSGTKGGQWTSGGSAGGGFTGTMDHEKYLVAPHLGQGGIARHRFEADPINATFVAPLKQTELTGKPAFMDNPHGYVLMEPSTPTPVKNNENSEDVATYVPGGDPGPGLNDVPFKPWDPPSDWREVKGQNRGKFDEPPMPNPGKKRIGAGVIIEEPDGRIWTISPLNQFGGYKETFPKGGIEPGLTLRQTAIKEAWEESGLKVELTGYLGDFERTTSVARYYRARRVTGDPTDGSWETQAVNAVPLTDLGNRVVHHADAPIIAALMGESTSVQKALCALADLIDLADYNANSEERSRTTLAKAKGGAWQKQMRVPKGLPKGGEWTTYGSGTIGGAYAAGGVALELQKHMGTGQQSADLNAKIQVYQDAANQGYLHPDAMKVLSGPMSTQTYSNAKYTSAAEAKAYVDHGGMAPAASKADAAQPTGHGPHVSDVQAPLTPAPKPQSAGVAEILDPGVTSQIAHMEAIGWSSVNHTIKQSQSKSALAAAAAKTAVLTGTDVYMVNVGLIAAKTPVGAAGWDAGSTAQWKAGYEANGGYHFTPDGQAFTSFGAPKTPAPKTTPTSKTTPVPDALAAFAATSFATTPAPLQTPVKPAKVQQAGTFTDPLKLSEMTKTGSKPGGSSHGGIHTDAYGQKWLVKSYDTPLQAMNEVAASKIYNLLGVHTPHMKLIDLGDSYKGGIGVASKYLDDVVPFDVNNPSHLSAAQANFGAHALMADWDAVGQGFDNIMISKTTGTAVLVDPGGSMLFRAKGGPKGDKLLDDVIEVNTMRNPAKNANAAKVFGPMSESAIAASTGEAANGFIDGLQSKSITKIIDDHLPLVEGNGLKAKMTKRAVHLSNQAGQLQANIASSTGVGIAKTGTTTATPTHSNPNVTAAAALSGAEFNAHIADLNGQINAAQFSITGYSKVVTFYNNEINTLNKLANSGDVEGVKNAFYTPTHDSAKLSLNYSAYLKAHAAAIKKAEAVAGQNLKQAPAASAGSMVTGDAKITPAQVESAKTLGGASKMADTLEPSVAIHIEPTPTPKPDTPDVLVPAPPMPAKPFIDSTPKNPNTKAIGQNDAIEKINNDPNLTPQQKIAQIHAISQQLPAVGNTYSKKVKSYAANSIAHHGGMHALDTMPKALKTEALNEGLAKGNDAAGIPKPGVVTQTVVQDLGNGNKLTTVTETAVIHNPPIDVNAKPDISLLPKPPDYANFYGPGQKFYNSKPELNALNTTAAQGLYAAALVSKTELDKVDVSYSSQLKTYKASLLMAYNVNSAALKDAAATWTPTTTTTNVVSSEFTAGKGTPLQPAKAISAMTAAMSFPKNWLATAAQQIRRFVILGKLDSNLVKAINKAIPSVVTSTKGAIAKQMAAQTNALSATHQKALKGHVGGNWESENIAFYKGDINSPDWKPAMDKAKKINAAIYDLPVGLVLSRRSNYHSANKHMSTPEYWNNLSGTVMNHVGIASASIDGAWGGNTFFKLKMADGVKGAYVAASSGVGVASETEVILPRNTKWVVVGARPFAEAMKDDPDLKTMKANRTADGRGFSETSDIVVEILVVPHDYPE